MLQVDLENIITEEEAVQKIGDIISSIESDKDAYVITKDGKPAIAIVHVELAEKWQKGQNQVNDPVAEPVAEPVVAPEIQPDDSYTSTPDVSMESPMSEPVTPVDSSPMIELPDMPSFSPPEPTAAPVIPPWQEEVAAPATPIADSPITDSPLGDKTDDLVAPPFVTDYPNQPVSEETPAPTVSPVLPFNDQSISTPPAPVESGFAQPTPTQNFGTINIQSRPEPDLGPENDDPSNSSPLA